MNLSGQPGILQTTQMLSKSSKLGVILYPKRATNRKMLPWRHQTLNVQKHLNLAPQKPFVLSKALYGRLNFGLKTSLRRSSQTPIIILTSSQLQCRIRLLVLLHLPYLAVVLEFSPSCLSRHLSNLVLPFPRLTNQPILLSLSQFSLLYPRLPHRAALCPRHL